MKILVIGSGFIAKPIIDRLYAEGHELLIFSRTQKQDIRANQITGDIFLFDDFIKTLLWNPQVIIHTAWATSHSQYINDPSNHRYAQFTSNLAKVIVGTDVAHLIILGSRAEYGSQVKPSTAGVTKLNPTNLYAQEKVASFMAANECLLESNIRLSWARIFQPYGPNQDRKRLLPYLIDSLRNGKKISLMDSSTILDWITTRDIASAISWVINNDTPTELDIGTSVGYTNVELLKHLEGLLGNSDQWAHFNQHNSKGDQVFVVGKDSPLYKSGWIPSDTLTAGLQWVLNS